MAKKETTSPAMQMFPMLKTVEQMSKISGIGENKLRELMDSGELEYIQNKFKVFLTSTGIVVGTATIMLVIAIGTGGKEEVAEQFKNLNAGSVDISYDYNGGSSFGNEMGGPGGGFSGGGFPGGGGNSSGFSGAPDMGGAPRGMGGFPDMQEQMNTEKIILSTEDVEVLEEEIPEITAATISYTTKQEAEGGNLDEAVSYTIAGVKEIYGEISNLTMAIRWQRKCLTVCWMPMTPLFILITVPMW